MYKGEKIILTPEEESDIREFVKIWKKDPRFKLNPVDDKRDLVSAKGAEYAFCKIAHIRPDQVFVIWDAPVFFDCIYLGNKIDVKHTDLHCRYLLCNSKNAEYPDAAVVDIYVHIKGKMPEFEYFGWVFKNELICPENNKRPFGGRMDAIPYSLHESLTHGYPIPRKGEENATETND